MTASAPPPDPSPERVTRLLERLEDGDREAVDPLFRLVYDDLRRLAGAAMARERPEHTLQATALVNEAWMKLSGGGAPPAASGRQHFLGIAARAMRQVLVDHARKRSAERRGGDRVRVTLADADGPGDGHDPDEMLALDRALDELNAVDARLRQVVEYRYFAGLTDDEIAGLLGVTRRTVLRDWAKARAWLHRALSDDGP